MKNDIFTNTTTAVRKYITLKAPSGHEIKYCIKLKRWLVISTNFNPMNFTRLFETGFLECESIRQMDSLGTYDDGTGYIIYFLNSGYNIDQLNIDIEKIFKTYFYDKI